MENLYIYMHAVYVCICVCICMNVILRFFFWDHKLNYLIIFNIYGYSCCRLSCLSKSLRFCMNKSKRCSNWIYYTFYFTLPSCEEKLSLLACLHTMNSPFLIYQMTAEVNSLLDYQSYQVLFLEAMEYYYKFLSRFVFRIIQNVIIISY